jgi:Fe(3+) dicitrate transport protein
MISLTRRRGAQIPVAFFVALSFLFTSMVPAVWGEDANRVILDEVKVVGSKSNIKQIAGSAAYIDASEIQKQNYDNVDRVLRKVPGVYTREETGQGLFPNISIRGVDPGRSTKVTIMEDGILTAPAPYSAPAAYYSPTIGRMSGLEVLKGSSQVRYGPRTTGGVINYLSTNIPTQEEYYLKATFGTFGEIRNHLYFGNTIHTDSGNFGYLIENYDRRNEGFRHINETADFRNGNDNNGLKNTEPMVKMSFEPNTERYQRFEFKFGYTKREANETYLGLNESLFKQDPFQRLAASRFDKLESEHFRTYLRHFFEMSDKTNIVTTAYGNHFFRNWQKSHDCRSTASSLSTCLSSDAGLALLNGTGAGTWRLRNNNRNYYLYGIQTRATHTTTIGATEHKFSAGVRYHYDQIRRFQFNEDYTQDSTGVITSRSDGAPGSAGNRRQKTTALAINLEDEIKYGKWTVKPGVRYEHLWQRFQRFAPESEQDRERNYGVVTGGGNANYKLNDRQDVFGGVFRGVSTPDPSGATKTGTERVEEETSIGYEFGTRYTRPEHGFSTELIGFWTDFDDLVVSAITGASGALEGETSNLGEVRSRGIEFQVQYDPAVSRGWSFNNPWYFTFTYTNAEFTSEAASAALDEENIFTGAKDGNEVPYVPEIQFAIGTGFEFEKFSINIDGQYIDETFGTGNNATTEVNLSGAADPRFGLVDDVFLLDVSMAYQFNANVKAFTNFRNVTDETYIASRLPHGIRAGAPFQMFGGMEFHF